MLIENLTIEINRGFLSFRTRVTGSGDDLHKLLKY